MITRRACPFIVSELMPYRRYAKTDTDRHAKGAGMNHGKTLLVIAVAALALPLAACAHEATMQECVEGSDFIGHAANARDNGMTQEAFMEKLEGDFLAIRQHPPELRWFAQDAGDEEVLRTASLAVFQNPMTPEAHASAFLTECIAHYKLSQRN